MDLSESIVVEETDSEAEAEGKVPGNLSDDEDEYDKALQRSAIEGMTVGKLKELALQLDVSLRGLRLKKEMQDRLNEYFDKLYLKNNEEAEAAALCDSLRGLRVEEEELEEEESEEEESEEEEEEEFNECFQDSQQWPRGHEFTHVNYS